MAGSIQKRGENSWLLSYHIGHDSKGKRIRKTKTVQCKNKSEAEKQLAKFIAKVDAGQHITPKKTYFKDFVYYWREERQKELAPSTIEMYDYLLNNRLIPHFERFKIRDINHKLIQSYIDALEQEGQSTSTIKKHYNILNGLFKMALDEEVIANNPMKKVKTPSVTHKETSVYDSTEIKQLVQLLNKQDNQQMALLIKMALNTGMRKGELLALQWEDVDFSTNTIHVKYTLSHTKQKGWFVKEPKTKESVRKVAPPSKLMKDLKKHIQFKKQHKMDARNQWAHHGYNFVFSSNLGEPLSLHTPNKWWNSFLDRTGFKKIRFHDLRHTATTNLINKGENIHSISKRLGHAKITTTMDIYGHYLEEADQRIAQMLDEDYF